MKKFTHLLAIVLSLAMVFALAACGQGAPKGNDSQQDPAQVESLGDADTLDLSQGAANGNDKADANDKAEANSEGSEQADGEPADATEDGSQEQEGDDANYPSQPAASQAPQREVLATSDDVDLYKVHTNDGRYYVAGSDGKAAIGYDLDEEENIIDSHGQIIVAAKNAKEFVPIKKLSFTKQSYMIDLHAQEDIVNNNEYITRINQYVTNVPVILNVAPSDITNGVVFVKPSNLALAEIRQNSNKAILAEGQFNLENGQVAIKATDPSKPITIMVSMKQIGTVRIFAEAQAGTATAECTITPDYGEVESLPVPTEPPTAWLNASDNAENHYHVHTYSMTVVEPTTTSQGYTEYKCVECGHSYRDNYVAKLAAPDPEPTPHIHNYESTIILPTETEQGYTLHVCSCGDSYKDSYTPALGG